MYWAAGSIRLAARRWRALFACVLGLVLTGTGVAYATDDPGPIPGVLVTKSFTDDFGDPYSPNPGGYVRLSFTIENLFDETATNIAFEDDFGAIGLVSGGGSGGSLCGQSLTGNKITVSGATLAAGASCSFFYLVQVPFDFTPGTVTNTTSDITYTVDGTNHIGLPATADLTVAEILPAVLNKEFGDDPITTIAGSTVSLSFTIHNPNPDATLESVSFTDDLSTVLSGLAIIGAPTTFGCSGLEVFTTTPGATLIEVDSIYLDAGWTCGIYYEVLIPADAIPDDYENITTAPVACIEFDGDDNCIATIEGEKASDTLTFRSVGEVIFTKEFTDDPVLAGGTVTLEITIENTDTVFFIDDLTFTDVLDNVVTGLVAIDTPVSADCADSGDLTGTSTLSLSGFTIGAATSCTWTVTLQVPADAPPGSHLNTTSELTGEWNAMECGEGSGCGPLEVDPATDYLTITALGPVLTKFFTDGTASAGTTAQITFIVANPNGDAGLASISFSDDLDFLPGTTLVSTDVNNCGATVSGTSLVTFSDFELEEAESCTITITVAIPGNAPSGVHTNTTTEITACLMELVTRIAPSAAPSCIPANGPPATDTIEVFGEVAVGFTKAFSESPVERGATVTLEFTITNPVPTFDMWDIAFTDDLSFLPAGSVVSGAPAMVCDGQLTYSGSVLQLEGASIAAGGTCVFSITIDLPDDAAPGPYVNVTSPLTACVGAPPLVVHAAPLAATPSPGCCPVLAAAASPSCCIAVSMSSPNMITLAGCAQSVTAAPATATLTIVGPTTTGDITIIAETTGGDGTFGYTGTLGGFSIATIAATGSEAFTSLAAGTYTVTASDPTPFVLIAIACSGDSDSGTVVTFASGSVAIDLDVGEAITCVFTYQEVVTHTQTIIRNFLSNRAVVVSQSGPSAGHFMNRFCPTDTTNDPINVLLQDCEQDEESLGALNFFQFAALVDADIHIQAEGSQTTADGDWAAWVEVIFSRYRSAPALGQIALFHAGVDYRVKPGIILGMMVEADFAAETSLTPAYAVSGRGWMIGPYFAFRLDDNLFVDGKVLWGRSQNAISPFMTYIDYFSTQRWLATIRFAGHADRGNWQFRPAAEALYYSETQNAYVDSNGILIPAQTVSFGQVAFGPEIGYRHLTDEGRVIEPTLRLEGIWTFAHSDPVRNGITGRVEAGISLVARHGLRLDLVGGYEGLFSPGFSAWSVRAQLAAPIGD
ncbi:MAG: autotransporter domain-containing protein [Bauldia sp.]|nr:autotransporter domain-containing protein [Bauldia sp.]